MSETGIRRVTETKGLFALRAWFRRNGSSKAALGARVGVSHAAVFQWLRGTSRPTTSCRKALEIVTGIPEDAWSTASERQRVAQTHGPSKVTRKRRGSIERGRSVQSASGGAR